MPSPYDLTGLTNETTLSGMVSYANTASNSILVGGFTIGIFIVMTMGFMIKSTFEKSVFASSFICFLLSLFLRQAGLINFVFPIGFLMITAFTGLYLYTSKS